MCSYLTHKLSVDAVATSEVSVSLTLNKNVQLLNKPDMSQDVSDMKLGNDCIDDEAIRGVFDDLKDVAELDLKTNRAIITLIANVQESSNVLAVVFQVMSALGVQVEMISQGASKVNISIVVPADREVEAIQALHSCFFEDKCLVPMSSPYEKLCNGEPCPVEL